MIMPEGPCNRPRTSRIAGTHRGRPEREPKCTVGHLSAPTASMITSSRCGGKAPGRSHAGLTKTRLPATMTRRTPRSPPAFTGNTVITGRKSSDRYSCYQPSQRVVTVTKYGSDPSGVLWPRRCYTPKPIPAEYLRPPRQRCGRSRLRMSASGEEVSGRAQRSAAAVLTSTEESE